MIQFEKVSTRGVAVVGDTVSAAFGKPVGQYAALVFNVVTQPSGSDIFSGLGTAGANLPISDLASATFASTKEGYYSFTAAAANGEITMLEIVCFPVLALSVDRVKYASVAAKSAGAPVRDDTERRGVLRALAMNATKAGAQAALESAAAVSPYYGTNPVTLGASPSANMTAFGGW